MLFVIISFNVIFSVNVFVMFSVLFPHMCMAFGVMRVLSVSYQILRVSNLGKIINSIFSEFFKSHYWCFQNPFLMLEISSLSDQNMPMF